MDEQPLVCFFFIVFKRGCSKRGVFSLFEQPRSNERSHCQLLEHALKVKDNISIYFKKLKTLAFFKSTWYDIFCVREKQSGGDSEEVTPVPMPNTVVKLFSADGSWGLPPVRVGRCRAEFLCIN